MRLLARWRQSWRRRPGRHAADPVLAPLLRLAQPPTAWTCPLCHHTWPYINPQHNCPGDRPPPRPAAWVYEGPLVRPYYEAWEREQDLADLRADLGPLVRTLLAQRAEGAPTQPLEVVR